MIRARKEACALILFGHQRTGSGSKCACPQEHDQHVGSREACNQRNHSHRGQKLALKCRAAKIPQRLQDYSDYNGFTPYKIPDACGSDPNAHMPSDRSDDDHGRDYKTCAGNVIPASPARNRPM